MQNFIVLTVVALASAIIGSMGVGGGTILLVYLTAFAGVAQHQAQGMNLLFFIPVAIVALILHTKSKLIDWRISLWAFLPGLGGAFLGFWISGLFDAGMLKKLFAIFLLILGIKEVFHKNPQKGQTQGN